jgi:steroid 5-alpha reductase family enzyme
MTDLNNPAFHSLFQTWIVLMMTVALICFIVSEITGNYSQVDKLWSIMPVAYGWITYAASPSPRILLMCSLITVWGLRLSYNFYRKGGYRLIPWEGKEDYRWSFLREQPLLKGRLRFGLFNLLFISLYQNVVILLFSTPLLLASIYPDKPLSVIDTAALLLIILFIITESVADNQLFEFHRQKLNPHKGNGYAESLKKGFMCEGVWKYSRHPNFASEQAIWASFYIFGVAASGRWLNVTIIGPLLLIMLFAGSSWLTEYISGKKYPDYSEYRKEVPRFIPFVF